ncbi:hypothetical protein [Branchiibius cervicis]|uniref:Uncharacterized protein n=1 Tax=Branchiibius cervicis TaxID=908252 RepID=A0ABW2AT42_9MICO
MTETSDPGPAPASTGQGPVKKAWWKRWWVWLIAVIVVAGAFGAATEEKDKDAASPAPTGSVTTSTTPAPTTTTTTSSTAPTTTTTTPASSSSAAPTTSTTSSPSPTTTADQGAVLYKALKDNFGQTSWGMTITGVQVRNKSAFVRAQISHDDKETAEKVLRGAYNIVTTGTDYEDINFVVVEDGTGVVVVQKMVDR